MNVNRNRLAICLALILAAPLGAKPLDVFKDCDVCPEMIELPMGEFIMGAPDDEFRSAISFDKETKPSCSTLPTRLMSRTTKDLRSRLLSMFGLRWGRMRSLSMNGWHA